MTNIKVTLSNTDPGLNYLDIRNKLIPGIDNDPSNQSFYFNSKFSVLSTTDFQRIPNYASFERDGIDLLDQKLIFANYSDNIKWISNQVTQENGSFLEDVVMSIVNMYTYFEYGLTLYFKNTDEIDFELVARYSDNTTKTIDNYLNKDINTKTSPIFIPGELISRVDEYVYTYDIVLHIKKINNVSNGFFTLYGLKFGEDIDISSYLLNDIVCFHDMPIPIGDVPIGTIDLTLQTEQDILSGQQIMLEVEQNDKLIYQNVYTISESESTNYSMNIKNIHGEDVISVLDTLYYTKNSNTIFPESPHEIENLSGIYIDFDDFLEHGLLAGYLSYLISSKTTCRQWLASYTTIGDRIFTTFNFPDGIKEVKIIPFLDLTDPDDLDIVKNLKKISSDHILGTVDIKKSGQYKGCKIDDVKWCYQDSQLVIDDWDFICTPVPGPSSLSNLGYYSPSATLFSYVLTNESNVNYKSKFSTSAHSLLNFNYRNNNFVLSMTIIYNGETIGELVKISLENIPIPNSNHDFDFTLGIIKSIELHIGHTVIANIEIQLIDW